MILILLHSDKTDELNNKRVENAVPKQITNWYYDHIELLICHYTQIYSINTKPVYELTYENKLAIKLTLELIVEQYIIMGVFSFEYESSSSIAPAKLFQALVLDADNLIPKVVPNAIERTEILQGDGGAGTIKKIIFPPGMFFYNILFRSNFFFKIYDIFSLLLFLILILYFKLSCLTCYKLMYDRM